MSWHPAIPNHSCSHTPPDSSSVCTAHSVHPHASEKTIDLVSDVNWLLSLMRMAGSLVCLRTPQSIAASTQHVYRESSRWHVAYQPILTLHMITPMLSMTGRTVLRGTADPPCSTHCGDWVTPVSPAGDPALSIPRCSAFKHTMATHGPSSLEPCPQTSTVPRTASERNTCSGRLHPTRALVGALNR